METAAVRNRLRLAVDRAKRAAAERRVRADEAARAFASFLDRVAVPLVRQIANVLRAEAYLFSVSTPSGSVRLTSDKNAEDYVELGLDATVDPPQVVAKISRSRGRNVITSERLVASGNPETITEEELLEFLSKELEPFVER